MTRFRAWVSDSEDESTSDDHSEAGGDASSDAGSSNQPDAPAGHTVDSDMYTDNERAPTDEPQSRESSASPPPEARRRADPTLVPRAREIGVDRQRMHVMQTALFRAPEEEAALRSITQVASKPSAKKLLLPSGRARKHGRDSDGDGVRADSRQVSLMVNQRSYDFMIDSILAVVFRSKY